MAQYYYKNTKHNYYFLSVDVIEEENVISLTKEQWEEETAPVELPEEVEEEVE